MCASMNSALLLNINYTNVVKVELLKLVMWRLWISLVGLGLTTAIERD
jgi:hypothetical protein